MSDPIPNIDDKAMSELKKEALRPVIVISASILILSITFNNVGFRRVIDAYAKSLEHKIENSVECKTEIAKVNTAELNTQIESQVKLYLDSYMKPYNSRLVNVEELAHSKGNKKQ